MKESRSRKTIITFTLCAIKINHFMIHYDNKPVQKCVIKIFFTLLNHFIITLLSVVKMSPVEKDNESEVAQQTSLLDAETENGLKNVTIQPSTGKSTEASELMTMIIKKVQSSNNDANSNFKQQRKKPTFEIPKQIKQKALVMQVRK